MIAFFCHVIGIGMMADQLGRHLMHLTELLEVTVSYSLQQKHYKDHLMSAFSSSHLPGMNVFGLWR